MHGNYLFFDTVTKLEFKMNRKVFFTGVMVLILAFAILPAANAVVLDPSGCPAGNSTVVKNLYAQYNISLKTCDSTDGFGLIQAYFNKKYNLPNGNVESILEKIPVSNLTWNEAYYMANLYSVNNIGKKYPLSSYNKDVDYVNRMINVQNTPQSRALAYIVMENAAGSMYQNHQNNQWDLEQTYYITMFLQNDPSGIINGGGSDWNISNSWSDLGLETLQQEGYNVPQSAVNFQYEAASAASSGKLNTQAELKKIGFYQWKKKYLIPIISEKAPQKSIPTKIVDTLPGILTFLTKYGRDLAKGIGGIFLLGIVLLIVRRRRNRYYY